MTHLSRMVGVAITLLLCSSAAHATPTAAERSVAVPLVIEGRARFDAQQYAAALELFKRAHEIAKAPTTGLDLAKTYEALGQLIEARKLAEEVANSPIEPNEKPIFAEARADARVGMTELDSRIPSLRVHIVGPPQSVARVSIDGKMLTSEEAGKPYPANPGKHTIVVDAPEYHPSEVSVALVESETMPVEIKLTPKDAKPQPPPPTPSSGPSTKPLLILGLTGGGLLVTSAITGIVANVANQNAADAARGTGCAPGSECKAIFDEQYPRSTTFSIVALATLGAGIGVGVGTLVYTLKASKPSDTANPPKTAWNIIPTPGGIVVRGVW